MLLNWCRGFGKQELIFATNMAGRGRIQVLITEDILNNWIQVNMDDGALGDLKDQNIIIAIVTGELLHEEQVKSDLVDSEQALSFGNNILRIRHASDNQSLGVFKVEVSELWPLIFLGESWPSLFTSLSHPIGYQLPLEIDNTIFLETAVTHVEPTMITKSIIDSL